MSTAQIDPRESYRDLYAARRTPALVDVPELSFLMVDGQGPPASAEFREAISALYSLAYTIKFTLKNRPDGVKIRMMPMEGLFGSANGGPVAGTPPADWTWTLMIMQPEAVTGEIVDAAGETLALRGRPAAAERVRLDRFCEGRAAQLLHVGPYSEEGPSISRLEEFIADQGYRQTGRHHEIYLGDPNRAAPERLKTIIRLPVEKGR